MVGLLRLDCRAPRRTPRNLKLAFELPAPTTTTTTVAAVDHHDGAPGHHDHAPTAPPPTTGRRTTRQRGVATWYAEAPAGPCASPWLPFGTDARRSPTVATGATITCVVDDREAAGHAPCGRPLAVGVRGAWPR